MGDTPRNPEQGRTTTSYLRQEKLTPEEMSELASRVMDRVRELAHSKLLTFPRLRRHVQTDDLADEALGALLSAWKNYADRTHFLNVVRLTFHHILLDMVKYLKAKGREIGLNADDVAASDVVDHKALTPDRIAAFQERAAWFDRVSQSLIKEKPEVYEVFVRIVVDGSERAVARGRKAKDMIISLSREC